MGNMNSRSRLELKWRRFLSCPNYDKYSDSTVGVIERFVRYTILPKLKRLM